MPWEDHLRPRGPSRWRSPPPSAGAPGRPQHPLRRAAGQGRGGRPLSGANGNRPSVDLARPDLRTQRPPRPRGDDREPGSLGRQSAPPGLPAGRRRGAAQGEPGRRPPPAGRMAGHRGSRGALVDPMCGSGTLLLEGALMAGDIAPGLLRDYYGFSGLAGFDRAAWDELLDEARRAPRDRGCAHCPRSTASTPTRGPSASRAPTRGGPGWPGASFEHARPRLARGSRGRAARSRRDQSALRQAPGRGRGIGRAVRDPGRAS